MDSYVAFQGKNQFYTLMDTYSLESKRKLLNELKLKIVSTMTGSECIEEIDEILNTLK